MRGSPFRSLSLSVKPQPPHPAAMSPVLDQRVADKFASYPAGVRAQLLDMRALILETAAEDPAIGPLEETLKWGEPAYLTTQSGSGSTLRIDWKTKAPDRYAIYFNCKTTLIQAFRTIFPGEFRFEGNRAIVFMTDEAVPMAALKFCIGAALTYHRPSTKTVPLQTVRST